MKCISLYQPWASLLFLPRPNNPTRKCKRFETRSKAIKLRGALLIHSAKTISREVIELAKTEPFKTALAQDPNWQYKRGLVLGAVNVDYCVKLARTAHRGLGDLLDEWERAFGNYMPGRFAWRFTDAITFENPFAVRGMQWIFDVPDEQVSFATQTWDDCPDWWSDAPAMCMCHECSADKAL